MPHGLHVDCPVDVNDVRGEEREAIFMLVLNKLLGFFPLVEWANNLYFSVFSQLGH